MRKCLPILLVLLAGCASSPTTPTRSTASADAAFNQLVDDYLAGYLAWRPALGVSLGLHEYDGKTTDMSRASIEAEVARMKSFDARLAAMDPASLGPRAAYDYRILRSSISKDLFDAVDMKSYARNPMTYAGALDVNTYIKRDFAPLEQRVHSIIAILRQAPAVMEAARTNLDDALPKPYVETAIDVADGSADFLQHDLVEALSSVHNAPLMSDFSAANQRAIAELRRYSAYLKSDKLPKATGEYALGRERYAKMLGEGELIPLSPEKVLEIGMAELRREQQMFAETAARIDPSKKPIEVFRDIQRDHPTAQGLIPDTRKDLETIRQFLVAHHIVTIPSAIRPRVEETPSYDRSRSFASMDSPGPFEKKATEAYYYVTPVEADWTPQQKEEWLGAFNYYTTDVVSIHEVYPGHYIQLLNLNASSANRLEKIMGSYAYIEGWAHYGEQMLVDEGFGADPANPLKAAKYRLAQLDESLLRVCRLCVSVQMHCQGMTVEQGAKFFQDNCYYEEKPSHAEAMRGTFDPGYLNYTLGKLMILKLREDYQAQEGAAFSLQKFHDAMLRHGMPPIPLLRQLLLKDPASWPNVL